MDKINTTPRLYQLLEKYGFATSTPGNIWCRGNIQATNYSYDVMKRHTRMFLPRRYKTNIYLPFRLEERIPEEKLEEVEATIKRIIVISELG